MSIEGEVKEAGKSWIVKHKWPILFGAVVLIGVLILVVLIK